MGFGLAGFVGLMVGGSIIALTVWLAHVSWVIAALVGLAVLLVFYAWGAYRDWDKADCRAEDADNKRREAESALGGTQAELESARTAAATSALGVPAAVNPAEWETTCDEAGEFPDNKALVFVLKHRFGHQGARLAFGDLRCTVTDPDGITTSATGGTIFYQYTEYYFKGAPPIRPGLYRFRWEGQKSNGEWADITSGEHEVQPPPKTGLEIVIEDEKQTPFPGAATVLEIEFRVTNHDLVPHLLRRSIRGLNRTSFPLPDDPDLNAAHREEWAIRDRRHRQGDELPGRVQPGETVRGVYVTTFPWDPTGTFPDYTLIIKDERQAYTARPHGAAEDPLAAWPIT
jgi:hypothetical protein